MLSSLRILRICAGGVNTLAIMAAGQTTPRRFQLQPWHKSNKVLARTENHTHPKQKSRNATCKGFPQPNILANTSCRVKMKTKFGGTHPRVPTLQSPLFMSNQKKTLVRVCRVMPNMYADRLDLFAITAAWPENSKAGEHTDKDTHQTTN